MTASERKKSEMDVQTEELIAGFSTVFSEITRKVKQQGRQPDPRAFVAAFVRLQASFLASIDDPHGRKVYRRSMEKLLPIELSKMLAADVERGQ